MRTQPSDGNRSAGSSPVGALARQGTLEDDHRGSLVDVTPGFPRGLARGLQGSLRGHGRQPLVHEAHGDVDAPRQGGGELVRGGTCRTDLAIKPQRQSYVDDCRGVLLDEGGNALHGAIVSSEGRLGDGEDAVRIAARYADAD